MERGERERRRHYLTQRVAFIEMNPPLHKNTGLVLYGPKDQTALMARYCNTEEKL